MKKIPFVLLAALVASSAFSGAPPALKAGEPDVLQDAVLWLDADYYRPLTWDWEMERWDARGGCLMGNSVSHNARPPILRKDKSGLPYVDFGKYSSGRDITFFRFTDIRTVFIVGKLDADRHCHFLCDSKGYDFHRGPNGEYASREWSPKIARVWNGTNEVADIYSECPPTGVTQVFCVETSAPCACDSLTMDRQIRARSGGRELREVLLFCRVLSDEERLAVTRHLIKKWNVKTVPSPRTVPTDWKFIQRDIDNWHRMPTNVLETSVNASACILPGDTDPLVVGLRRTRALLDDLSASVDLTAERTELAGYALDAFAIFDTDSRIALFTRVMNLNRRISLKNPLLKGIDRLLFVTHEPCGFNEWRDGSHMCDQYYGFHGTQNGISRGDGLYILENPFSDKPVARNILAGKVIESGAWKGQTLDGCAIISPDIDWDGKRIAFAAVKNNSKLDKWEDGTCYHVFTCNLDGSNLRQLTSGPWNEFDPCWLPNGRIAFTSERRGGYVRCSGNRPVPSFTLHTMFDDGTDIVRLSHHETNEWHPSVNSDGMIVYTRWDYVDRGSGQAHHAWTCFPDGRDPRELNGNTRINADTTPRMEMNIRQIPGSRKYVSTATPHHGWAAGALIMIDPSVPDDGEMSAIRRITPEQPFPEAELNSGRNRNSGAYATAWPLSEKYYICTYDGNANGMYNVPMRGRRYAITLIDVFGNKTRLWAHPTISCLDPMPLMARKRPPVLAHQTLEGRPERPEIPDNPGIPENPDNPENPENPVKTGEIGLINVYDTRIPFPTNETITALRVWQLFPKVKPLQQKPWLGAEIHQTGRQCLGTVPVEADGSAYFTAPVGVPIFFQALRADGCAVQSMRSDTYLHPGERLLCSGCHEPKENVRRTALTTLPLAMRRAPSAIKPGPDGSAPFNYVRLVQPVLDAKCVSCHGEKRNPRAPDLRAGDWRKDKWGFSTSWNNLVHRTNYFAWEMVVQKRVDWRFFTPAYTEPGRYLAMNAPLRKMLDAGHHGVKLTPEERERLILWMDSNGQYIAHDHDAEAQRDGKIVKPALE
ncbi:MAG: PD40 domain-containing protein [Kiritimatiellae bacterium]|nr:PD40 domain-containing protein [Kiritimatiellia bacterium]